MTRQPLWLLLAPFLFLILWSGGYVVAKVALQYASPMAVLAIRFGSVVLIMGVAFAIFRPKLPGKAMDWLHLVIVGVLMQTVYFGMSYIAFANGVAAGTAALLMSWQPIIVALVAPRWAGERVVLAQWIGLVVAFIGTALVILSRLEIGPPPLVGFGFAALALMGITGASLWEKRFGVQHHPIIANLVGYAAGLVCLMPFVIAEGAQPIEWNAAFVAAMGYLVIGNSVIAVGLLLAMIRAGEVARVSALMFLVPPGAALGAWWLLGEAMPLAAWLGLAIAGVGVILATRKSH